MHSQKLYFNLTNIKQRDSHEEDKTSNLDRKTRESHLILLLFPRFKNENESGYANKHFAPTLVFLKQVLVEYGIILSKNTLTSYFKGLPCAEFFVPHGRVSFSADEIGKRSHFHRFPHGRHFFPQTKIPADFRGGSIGVAPEMALR